MNGKLNTRERMKMSKETLRVYLDTSAVSHLQQSDAPDKVAATVRFFDAVKAKRFSVVMSDVTVCELSRCSEQKRKYLFDFMDRVGYTLIITEGNATVNDLLQDIRELGVLPKRSVADMIHIAAAVYSGCDIIASWNFKHLTNPKTVDGVRTISLRRGLPPIDILSPEKILEVYL